MKQRRCGPFWCLPVVHRPGLLKRHTFIAGSADGSPIQAKADKANSRPGKAEGSSPRDARFMVPGSPPAGSMRLPSRLCPPRDSRAESPRRAALIARRKRAMERPMATQRILDFLATRRPDGPCLVVDLDVVRDNFRAFEKALPDSRDLLRGEGKPGAGNPAPARLRWARPSTPRRSPKSRWRWMPARPADRISFGNTIKKERDIARAFALGIRLFAVDCVEEVEKIARAAPGARVFCRVLTDGEGAEWPLSRKFGCVPAMAVDVLRHAKALGLDAYGVSFHVGSQQTDLDGLGSCARRRQARLRDAGRGGHRAEDGQHGRRLPDPLPEGRAGGAGLWPGDLLGAAQAFRQRTSRRPSSSRAAAWSAMPASSSRKSC